MTQELITDLELLEWDRAVEGVPPGVRQQIRLGVSERMVQWMGGRDIVQRVGIVEYHTTANLSAEIATNEWPIANETVEFNLDVLILDQDYRLDADGIITMLNSNGQSTNWPGGEVKITYDGGYTTVPADLRTLAAIQCVADIMFTNQKFWGLRQRDPETGAVLTIERNFLLPQVEEGIRPYRRRTYGF